MSLKKLKKTAKKIGRVTQLWGSRVLSVAAPILGAVVLGPAGAALGTAVGSAAARFGGAAGARLKGKKGVDARTRGRSEMRRSLATGGAITGIAGGLALAGGGGLMQGILEPLKNLLGMGGGSDASSSGDGVSGELLEMPPEALAQWQATQANPGQQAADQGILGAGLDVLKKIIGGAGETDGGGKRPNGEEETDGTQTPIADFFASIPRGVWIAAGVAVLAVIALKMFGSRRK